MLKKKKIANPTGALELRLPIRTPVLGRNCQVLQPCLLSHWLEVVWGECGLSLKAEMPPEGVNSWRLSITCTPCSWIASSFLMVDLGHLYSRHVPQSHASDFSGEIDIRFTFFFFLNASCLFSDTSFFFFFHSTALVKVHFVPLLKELLKVFFFFFFKSLMVFTLLNLCHALFIYVFIYGCVGSSFLCEGFL